MNSSFSVLITLILELNATEELPLLLCITFIDASGYISSLHSHKITAKNLCIIIWYLTLFSSSASLSHTSCTILSLCLIPRNFQLFWNYSLCFKVPEIILACYTHPYNQAFHYFLEDVFYIKFVHLLETLPCLLTRSIELWCSW